MTEIAAKKRQLKKNNKIIAFLPLIYSNCCYEIVVSKLLCGNLG